MSTETKQEKEVFIMANRVYYVIKVMVYRDGEEKEMFFDFETESLLDNWMEACTQEYTQDELLFLVTAFSLNWENKLTQQWKSSFPDLDFHNWSVIKVQVNFQTL